MMPQSWRLINIDRKEATGSWGNPQDFFYYSSHDSLNVVDYLTPLVLHSSYKSDIISLEESFQRYAQTNRNMASTGILPARLPIELVLRIVEHLRDDYLPLLCLSLTCTFFWDITGQARYHSLTSAVNKHSWAGDRIILVGDSARSLPPSILSDNDVEELRLNGRSDTLAEALYDAARDFKKPSQLTEPTQVGPGLCMTQELKPNHDSAKRSGNSIVVTSASGVGYSFIHQTSSCVVNRIRGLAGWSATSLNESM
ncbi:hypothetical protein C8R42DRAFT_323189 [Lentinula raphanica]|nr:hypothetical protein C8R42DRAFT_323189 [Lentinula raphanica]